MSIAEIAGLEINDEYVETEDFIQLVTFRVGEEEFAVEILDVHEIIRLMQITPVPNAERHIIGVLNLRGKVIPVVGMRRRFGLEDIASTTETRIIVMEVNQKVVGFLVDSVSEVLYMDTDKIAETPSLFTSVEQEYIQGIGKLEDRLIILLDFEELFAEAEE